MKGEIVVRILLVLSLIVIIASVILGALSKWWDLNNRNLRLC